MFSFKRLGQPKTLSFAALLLLLFISGTLFCNLSLQYRALNSKVKARVFAPLEVIYNDQFRSDSPLKPLLSVKKETNITGFKFMKEIEDEAIVPLKPLLSVKEETNSTKHKPMEEIEDEANSVTGYTPIVPPIDLSEEQRIAWFRTKLPEFEILKSTALTQQFAKRADKFFNKGCDVRFFMTWISPAESFSRKDFFALESLFKAHPDGCLMILSRTMDSRQGNQILKPLTKRGFKVAAVAPDLKFLFSNTPAEAWFDAIMAGNKDPGEIPLAQNLSNLLRLVVLYKYGGVYLDTDFIILKSLSGLRNSIGAQSMDQQSGSWTRLNNAVLIFDKNHPLVYKFIEEFASTFDGNKWGHNGPYLVSRVVMKVAEQPGLNVTILPPMAFYPVDWTRISGLFLKPESRAYSRWIAAKLIQLRGETYGVHLWNKQSNKMKIEEGSIIGKLISDHCVLCQNIYEVDSR